MKKFVLLLLFILTAALLLSCGGAKPVPTIEPTGVPTMEPTVVPTIAPTVSPTVVPEVLAFSLNADGISYTVTGMGSFTGKDLVIPEEHDGKPVTAVGNYAFSGTDITSAVIPDSVTDVFSGAFDSCPALAKVTVGKNVKNIRICAFYKDPALTEVVFLSPENWKARLYSHTDYHALPTLSDPKAAANFLLDPHSGYANDQYDWFQR